MPILRVGGVILLLTVAVLLGMWLFTRDRRYLTWAWRIARLAILLTAAFFAIYALERLVMLL